ncbi:MAG: hypothetical protein P8Z30_03045 [Acidobacteriota bacterium]
MDIMKPISRRRFVKNSIAGSVAAMAALRGPADQGLADSSKASSGRLRFGANYVPRKRWWYCWQDWDQQSVVEDLSGVADLGMDHVRIQCLWPMFQPGISSISDSALENLGKLLDAADHAGLDVEVTVLNGWMSGLRFQPPWAAPLKRPSRGHDGNMFVDRQVIDAEKLLFRRLARTVGSHRRFLGFDIGNELSVLQTMSNPATPEQADAWATEILAECDAMAPGKFHVNGVDDTNWFADFGFSRENLANTGHATVVHCYVFFTGALKRYKYSGVGSLHLADYMVELAYAYQNDLRRRVWVEEIGVSPEWMPEAYLPEFMEHTVRNVAETGKSWGVTWWSSHDIDPAIKGFDSLEYTLGLLDLHNKPKPLGRKFASLAKELRQSPPEIAPRPVALVIPDHGLSTKPWPADWTYATPYMDLLAQGKKPVIVLESRAKDEPSLKAPRHVPP